MTIHSDWGRVLHSECPHAFTTHVPKDIPWKVGVIDGHLQLMCLNSHFKTWDRFMHVMYVLPIQKLFKLGCPKVVLCFDNYEKVPVYKNMTQLKRCKGKQIAVFDSKMSLPTLIPEDTMLFLMNRNFKVKLVQYICTKISTMLTLSEHQEFIVDYKTVVSYTIPKMEVKEMGESMVLVPCPLQEFESMGESDVKFVRYVEKYGNALIHAIDGDYIVIALIYLSKSGIFPKKNEIFILRQKTATLPSDEFCEEKEDSTTPCLIKRKLKPTPMPKKSKFFKVNSSQEKLQVEQKVKSIQSVSELSLQTSEEVTFKKDKKEKWWLNMHMIFRSLVSSQTEISESWSLPLYNETDIESTISKVINMQLFSMLLTGTDFSRGLPLLGPKRIREFFWQVIDLKTSLPDFFCEDYLVNNLINEIYGVLWSKHVPCVIIRKHNWEVTYNYLKHNSSVSEATKRRIPTKDQLICTIRNINWLMEYWTTWNATTLCPLDNSNGYKASVVDAGKVVFSDIHED